MTIARVTRTVLCLLCLVATGSSVAPVAAADAAAQTPPDFPTRVLPVLTKAGCNAGACHGAATGQGGFKLSLLGYDPEADHLSITRELAGRRIDLATPADSLLLQKATRSIPHKGGARLGDDTDDYRDLVAWIGDGAPYGPRGLRVTGIEVRPDDLLLSGPGRSAQLAVTATLSDGTRRDVTRHALYGSNDDAVADVAEAGNVTLRRRGLTAIMVRYAGQVAAVRVASPYRDGTEPVVTPESRNFVDEKVFAELRRLRVAPSALAGDSEFLRRVFLDVIGGLPTAAETRAFLGEPPSAQKRTRVIADLLARDEFNDLWTLRLADLLLVDSKRLGDAPARAYHAWLRERVSRNVPVDRLVCELITATGDGAASGPANFHRLSPDPRDMGEFVGRAFLGVQLACARCHAHPFAAWTQDDYYGFAAYFARTRHDGARVVAGERGEVQNPRTGANVEPKPLGEPSPPGAAGRARLSVLGEWLTSPRNPYFARAFVNRVWRHLLGRGLVEPVDDLRVTNPPSNPALLDALAADFVASGYDLRHLVGTIVGASTYQLSGSADEGNRADVLLFSHAYPKPLDAAVLADAIARAAGVADAYPGFPAGTRAVQLVDARTPSQALDVLGRCTRDVSCVGPDRRGGTSLALHLINGTTVNGKLRQGVVDRLAREGRADAEIVDELYLRTLCRFPSAREKQYCVESLNTAGERRLAVEDLLWALLNGREFVVNH